MSRVKGSLRRARRVKRVGNVDVVHDTTVGGMRQMRCQKCHQMMVPATTPDGTNVLRCSSCGNQVTTKKL
jgi:NAD-dependent SIR2 family protein deacetylase